MHILYNSMLKKSLVFFIALLFIGLILTIATMSWTLSMQNESNLNIAETVLRTEYWQGQLQHKKQHVITLLHYIRQQQLKINKDNTKLMKQNRILNFKRDCLPRLSAHVRNLWSNSNHAAALVFEKALIPTIYSMMPHLMRNGEAEPLKHAYVYSKGRTNFSIVIGIRSKPDRMERYLLPILKNLTDNMLPHEKQQTLLVVYLAESNQSCIEMAANSIQRLYMKELEMGVMDIVAPARNYYGNLSVAKDEYWRLPVRQMHANLDYIYIMMYAQTRGQFYLQLADNVQLSSTPYITQITSFIVRRTVLERDWLLMDFGNSDATGKLFKTLELPKLITFFYMFYENQPLNWLLHYYGNLKYCDIDTPDKLCLQKKSLHWATYAQPLFKTILIDSSDKFNVKYNASLKH